MAQMQQPPRTSRPEFLANAADGGWALTNDDLADHGVGGSKGWKDNTRPMATDSIGTSPMRWASPSVDR